MQQSCPGCSGMFLNLRSTGHAICAPSGRSWRVDETYLKVRAGWVYLYRAVDRIGDTVDFRLSSNRNVAAAKAFSAKRFAPSGALPSV